MEKILKISCVFRFGDLLDNAEERRLYSNELSFTYSTPYVFYLWLISKKGVIFYRRPRNVTRSSVVEKVRIYFSTHKDARDFAFKKVDRKILQKIFNNRTKHVIL